MSDSSLSKEAEEIEAPTSIGSLFTEGERADPGLKDLIIDSKRGIILL
jgi:hypothetical protein